MIFLIEVNFRKESKIGTMLSKIKKVRKLRHFCCKLNELHPTFFLQLRLEYLIISTLRSLEVLFFNNFRDLNKNWDLFVKQRTCFVVSRIFGFLRPIPTKKQLFLETCLLEIPVLVIVEFFKPLYARK